MRTRWICLLGLAALLLALSGDSCVTEKRTVDIVVTANIPAEWTTSGTSGAGFSQATVNAAPEINDALDKLDEELGIDSVLVAGACYEVISSSGRSTRRTGDITINTHPLLHFDVPNNDAGTTGDTNGATLTLQAEGVSFLNDRLNQYLLTRNESLLEFTFAATWSSPGAAAGTDSFAWKTCVVLQLKGKAELDIPDL
jgi:hypothetical protein